MRRIYRIVHCSLFIILAGTGQMAGGQNVANRSQVKPQAKDPAAARTKNQQQPGAPSGTPAQGSITLFAISQNRSESYIDPIAVYARNRFIAPPSGTEEQAVLSRFANRYYREGQKYTVLFGGGRSGTVTVKSWLGKDGDCNRSMAGVTLDTQAKIDGKVMAVATNEDTLGRRTSSRRMPTATERAAALKLAQGALRQKAVPATLLAAMRTINLTAVDLNGDGKDELIGSYSTREKEGKAGHTLLLIAEPQANDYRAALVRYAKITPRDLMEGTTLNDLEDYVLAEILVDHIDIDGDNRSEVIVMRRGFEGVTYRIFKRDRGVWGKAFEFYSYKCAY